jgi:iron complex outermembrane receptor protein
MFSTRVLSSATSGIALAAALSATAFAAPAMAQAPEAQARTVAAPAPSDATAQGAANANGVEEIIVTAQFRQQNLQKTPLAITAISGAMLEARSQTNIAQVANQAPSVTLKPQGAAFGPSLLASIRGVGQYDFNPALEPGVGLYVDDVYYATLTGSVLDLLDLDRVEVLRGPQGTLAGRNSIGGAIKLYSKKPTGDGTGYVSATYGSRNRVDIRASADLKIADDLFLRLAGVAKKQGGYIKRLDFGCVYPAGASAINPAGGIPRLRPSGSDCLLAKDGDVDYNAVRAQIRYAPSSEFEINLIGDYTHDDRKSAGSVLRYANFVPTRPGIDINPYSAAIPYDSRFICGKYCNYASFQSAADTGYAFNAQPDRATFKGYGFSGSIDWSLAEKMQLKSITAYRHYTTQFGNDDDVSPLAHSLGYSDLSFYQFSQEVRLNGSIGNKDAIEYTVGGFYFKQKSVYSTLQDLRYAGLTPIVGHDPVPADSKAVFAQFVGHVTDQLTLTGGIRYTKDKKTYTYSRLSPDGTPQPVLGGLTGVVGQYSGDRVDYRANAQYQITPLTMVYAQFSTGYKGGGINPRPFAPSQVQPFSPETLQSYELGFKTDAFDRKVRLNLAAFYSNYKQIQIAVLSCPQFNPPPIPVGAPGFPCALPVNAGNAHVKGAEAELSLRPIEGMSIDGSLSYVGFHYYDVDTAKTGVTPNMRTAYNPKWKWSVGAQYEFDMGSTGSLTPRVDAAYQSHLFSNAVNGPLNRISGYTVGNARLIYRNSGRDWEAALEVTNFTNKYYLLSNFDLTGAGAGVSSDQPGRPREWALTVKKKF